MYNSHGDSFFIFSDVIQFYFLVTSSLYGYQHSFGQGTGSAFLSGVSCTGTESTLLRCRISTFGQYYCSGDAGVVCPCMFHVIILQ